MRQLLALILLCLAANAGATSPPDKEKWRLHITERTTRVDPILGAVEKLTVHFSGGKAYEIPLYHAAAVAVLQGDDETFFLLAAGSDCTSCDENTTLRFFRLGEESLNGSGARHSYPGTLVDYLTGAFSERTRTFYGRCLGEHTDVVVWFQDYRADDGLLRQASWVVRMAKGGEAVHRLSGKEARLSSLVSRTLRGGCVELPGTDGTTEP